MRGKKLTIEEIQQDLIPRNIELIEYGGTTQVKSKLKCLNKQCNFLWKATIHQIRQGCGCPKCGGTLKLTIEDIKRDLITRNLELIEYGGKVSTISKIKCTKFNCGHEWEHILSNRKSINCPCCTTYNSRLTIEEIKSSLFLKNIELLEYGGIVSKHSKFKCSKSRLKI